MKNNRKGHFESLGKNIGNLKRKNSQTSQKDRRYACPLIFFNHLPLRKRK